MKLKKGEMNMKKIVALLLALVMVVGLVACGNSNQPGTSNPPASQPGTSTPPRLSARL